VNRMQSVTDTKCVVGETFDSRNGGVVTGGVTDTKSEVSHQFDTRYAYLQNCDFCGKCGRKFNKDEIIWRVRISPWFYLNRSGWTVAPVCEQCRPGYLHYLPEKPCEYCGRLVINEAWGRRWYCKHTYCSERCGKEHDSIIQKSIRAQRRQQREYACGVCEKSFRPSRRDALHCSSACRQRDYRNRQREVSKQQT